MAAVIYALCMGMSLWVAALLWRHYRKTGSRLLYWSALCFAMLTVNNLLLVADKLKLVDIDLSLLRQWCALAAMAVLLFGLIYEDD